MATEVPSVTSPSDPDIAPSEKMPVSLMPAFQVEKPFAFMSMAATRDIP